MTSRKQLLEVTLPLEANNVVTTREKSIRNGHLTTRRSWWARLTRRAMCSAPSGASRSPRL